MGFLSWVRRVRDVAPSSVGRPLAGLLGAPARTAPPQRPDPDVPSRVTTERIGAWLTDQGFTWFVDDDGDMGGLWRGRLFYFFLFGDEQEILQVRGQWNREVALERLPEVLELCNGWNTDHIWPKAYARVRDDGMVHLTCEVATDLEHGATDAQLGLLLECGLGSAATFFDALAEHYPDPAASAP